MRHREAGSTTVASADALAFELVVLDQRGEAHLVLDAGEAAAARPPSPAPGPAEERA